MAQKKSNVSIEKDYLIKPEVGSSLTILSGLAFLALCMALPLVGKSVAKTNHVAMNYVGFYALLFVTITICALAIKSKLSRSKLDGSPFPLFSAAIGGLCVLLLISLVLGLLKI